MLKLQGMIDRERSVVETRGARSRRNTVSATTVEVLLNALDAIGGDVEETLSRAGLPRLWRDADAGRSGEIDRVIFVRLAKECLLAFHGHSCRQDALRPFPLSDFRLMCLAMLACPTLRFAIETAGAFLDSVLGGSERLNLTICEGRASLTVKPNVRGKRLGDTIVTMYSLATFARLFGWLIGSEIKLSGVKLAFPEKVEHHAFDELFRLNPSFDHPQNVLEFSDYYLARPVIRKFEELPELFAMFPFDLYAPDDEAYSMESRVRAAIDAAIARGASPPDMARMAKMFGLTVPTFRRRLANESAFFSEIVKDCRLRLSVQLLLGSDLTIESIASRVQFTDVASFRRAFRSWTGQSPQKYRFEAKL